LIKLVRLFRKIRPDIVHTHTPKAGLLGMWAAWLTRVPVRLHTIAGLPWVETKGPLKILLKLIEKLTAMPALQLYPNSGVQHDFLRQQHIAPRKLKVLGQGSSNGINTRYFLLNDDIANAAASLRENEKIKPGAWIWIFVGRLVKNKGIGELLDAFQALNQQFPDDRLWLLGKEEPELDPLENRHRQLLHSGDPVRYWGFQNDIRPYLAASAVLAFPSYREGFPNVPLQAGAMGCMLLLSDINGCNEIVQNGINGMLVPAKNTEQLREAMLFIRQQPGKRTQYADAARHKIMNDYDQQKLWEILLKEYQYWLLKKGLAEPERAS
jgi:glycosyltransferase involved in cell wall biosynthesis